MSNAQRFVASVFGMLVSIGVMLGSGQIVSAIPESSNGFVTVKLPSSIALGLGLLLIVIAAIALVAMIWCMLEAWDALGKMNGR